MVEKLTSDLRGAHLPYQSLYIYITVSSIFAYC
jgi:hypothetical protein